MTLVDRWNNENGGSSRFQDSCDLLKRNFWLIHVLYYILRYKKIKYVIREC